MTTELQLPLTGPGGEPVDLWRTMNSHGFAELAPTRLDEEARTLEVTLRIRRGRPRRVRIREGRPLHALVEILGPAAGVRVQEDVAAGVRHVLRLDDDLSDFYAKAVHDHDLAWAATGAGRMLQGPSVFEDVVKTVCTTNCTWSATVRMVNALVQHLGEPAIGDREPLSNAFPTPERMADTPETFYRDVARAGYRGAYPRALARSVADGELTSRRLRPPLPTSSPTRSWSNACWRSGRGTVRGRPHHDDDRPELPVDPRFVDTAEVRAPGGEDDRERRADPAAVRALRRSRGTGVLAVRDPRLGDLRRVVQAFLASHTGHGP